MSEFLPIESAMKRTFSLFEVGIRPLVSVEEGRAGGDDLGTVGGTVVLDEYSTVFDFFVLIGSSKLEIFSGAVWLGEEISEELRGKDEHEGSGEGFDIRHGVVTDLSLRGFSIQRG